MIFQQKEKEKGDGRVTFSLSHTHTLSFSFSCIHLDSGDQITKLWSHRTTEIEIEGDCRTSIPKSESSAAARIEKQREVVLIELLHTTPHRTPTSLPRAQIPVEENGHSGVAAVRSVEAEGVSIAVGGDSGSDEGGNKPDTASGRSSGGVPEEQGGGVLYLLMVVVIAQNDVVNAF